MTDNVERMKDYRLYILMRNDLQSLTPGRAAAQASHASNAFIHKFGKRADVKEWQRQTEQGFGTAIVLGVDNKQLISIFEQPAIKHWLVKDKVYDPEYVIRVTHEIEQFLDKSLKKVEGTSDGNTIAVTRVEITCAYIFGTKEELQPYLGELPLY
jgi:peptidyl-tRNA hydrolase